MSRAPMEIKKPPHIWSPVLLASIIRNRPMMQKINGQNRNKILDSTTPNRSRSSTTPIPATTSPETRVPVAALRLAVISSFHTELLTGHRLAFSGANSNTIPSEISSSGHHVTRSPGRLNPIVKTFRRPSSTRVPIVAMTIPTRVSLGGHGRRLPFITISSHLEPLFTRLNLGGGKAIVARFSVNGRCLPANGGERRRVGFPRHIWRPGGPRLFLRDYPCRKEVEPISQRS